MTKWLYEAGIGESRAALVEDDRIIEARIKVEGRGVGADTVTDARLVDILIAGRRGVARTASGEDILVEPLLGNWCEGGTVRIEVTREAIAEPGHPKRAKGRPAAEAPLATGPDLRARLAATNHPVEVLTPNGPDALEEAGWSETMEMAQTGIWPFTGGMLRIEPTAAATVIDVDGHLAPASIALAAAEAAARAIRCLDIAGSILIDFPSLADKRERQATAETFDSVLPPPFERTAINGFGLMQIIRPRRRASLIELIQRDRAGHAARALLRRAERSGQIGASRLVAPPPVATILEAHPEWLDRLARALGGAVTLHRDPALAMSACHVEAA